MDKIPKTRMAALCVPRELPARVNVGSRPKGVTASEHEGHEEESA